MFVTETQGKKLNNMKKINVDIGTKYKVGDKVLIRSIDWYNKNKYEDEYVSFVSFNHGFDDFYEIHVEYCGQIATITDVYEEYYFYAIDLDHGEHSCHDGMFECKVED
jgi:hypothetical protein